MWNTASRLSGATECGSVKILCFSLSREEAESLTSQTEISKGERGDRRTLSLIHLSTTPQCNLSRKMTPCLYRWSFLLLFTALVPIELFSQILLRAYRVARKIRRSKELVLAFGTRSHERNFVHGRPDNQETTLCHDKKESGTVSECAPQLKVMGCCL